jgi:hypothetical protein
MHGRLLVRHSLRRSIRIVRWLAIRTQYALAKNGVISRLLILCMSFLSRNMVPCSWSKHIEATVCAPGSQWPSLDFRPLTATVGIGTKIRLVPHIGEFDQSVLFRNHLDYESGVSRWLESVASSKYYVIIEVGANVGVYSVFFDALTKQHTSCRLRRVFSSSLRWKPIPGLSAISRLTARRASYRCAPQSPAPPDFSNSSNARAI